MHDRDSRRFRPSLPELPPSLAQSWWIIVVGVEAIVLLTSSPVALHPIHFFLFLLPWAQTISHIRHCDTSSRDSLYRLEPDLATTERGEVSPRGVYGIDRQMVALYFRGIGRLG